MSRLERALRVGQPPPPTPYEESAISTFNLYLGFAVGVEAGVSGKVPVISANSLQRTKLDAAWGDVLATVGSSSLLLEFKRDHTDAAVRKEIEKGKYHRVRKLESRHRIAVQSGHWYVYDSQNPKAVLYKDIERLLVSDVDDDSIDAVTFCQRFVGGRADVGAPIEFLARYLSDLRTGSDDADFDGLFLIKDSNGKIHILSFSNITQLLKLTATPDSVFSVSDQWQRETRRIPRL